MRKWGISAAFMFVPVVAILISAQAASLAWERHEPTPLTAPHLGVDRYVQVLAVVPPTVVATAVPAASIAQTSAAAAAPTATAGAPDKRMAELRRKLKKAEAGIGDPGNSPATALAAARAGVPASPPETVSDAVSSVASVVVHPSNPIATAPAPAVPQPLAIPERLYAPTIRLDTSIVPVGWKEVKGADGKPRLEWVVASYRAGWHKNSALPGQGGNVVLAAHNNMEGEIFRDIELLKPGDTLFLFAGGREYKYVVSEKFTVQEKGVSEEQRRANAKWIGPFAEERLTLISCWPYTGDTHRMFVIAKPAS